MNVNKRTDSLLVFDDVAIELRNGERTFRVLVIRAAGTPEVAHNNRLASFSAESVGSVIEMAKLLDLKVRIGQFSDDPQGFTMVNRLRRALDTEGMLR